MKKILLSLALIVSINAFSQADTRTIEHCGYSTQASAINHAAFDNIINADECVQSFTLSEGPPPYCYTLVIACVGITLKTPLLNKDSINPVCTYNTNTREVPADKDFEPQH